MSGTGGYGPTVSHSIVEIAGPFAGFAEDPWSDPHFTRASVVRRSRCRDHRRRVRRTADRRPAAGARRAQNIRLIDKAADVGGTWYWNRYPGIACDVESYVYMPLLEELGYIPTEKYAKGDEIFAHCRRIAEHYDLYRDACLQTEVSEIRWDEAAFALDHLDQPRRLRSGRGSCRWPTGTCRSRNCPASKGSWTSAGTHSTPAGGTTTTPDADLAKLADKRVGIIGTGATAIQCVPHLGEVGGAAVRVPAHPVDGRRARQPADRSGLVGRPGRRLAAPPHRELPAAHRRRRGRRGPGQRRLDEHRQEAVRDAADAASRGCRTKSVCAQSNSPTSPRWRRSGPASTRSWPTAPPPKASNRGTATSASGRASTTSTCRRSTATTSRSSTPKACGVERITAGGVVVDGTEHRIDCLIFATGFEVGTDYSRRTGFELVGRDGLTLTDKWRDGVRTLHGLSVHGFPNCFVLSIAQSGFTVNFPYLLDVQATPRGVGDRLGTETTRDREARGVRRGRNGMGRHRRRSGLSASAERAEVMHARATTTGKARRTRRPARAASSTAAQPNTPTFSTRRRANGAPEGFETFDECRSPIPRRVGCWRSRVAAFTAGGDHRGRFRRTRRGSGVAAQRH